jgi:hypothetical protein
MQFLGGARRGCEDGSAMLGRLRSVLGVAFLAGCTWCSFVVPLGDKTFVEHLDAIGDTPEAEALRAGANQALVPSLDELQQRVLGEYVEAPTTSDVTLASGAPGEAPPIRVAREPKAPRGERPPAKGTSGARRGGDPGAGGKAGSLGEPSKARGSSSRATRPPGIPRAQ